MPEKIKIVYVMPYTYWGGGLQMNRLTLLQELVGFENLDITICVLEFSGKTSEIFREMGLKEVCLSRKAKFIYPKTTLALYKVLRKINPDIVHTGNVDADIHGFLATRFLNKTKLVVEEIGTSQDRKWHMRILHRIVYERADKVLCVSPDILNDMRNLEGLKRRDVEITFNPVNLKHLSLTTCSPQQLRDLHQIPNNHFIFGIISRFEEVKGHIYLFEALSKIISYNKNVSLVVVGDGPLKNKFKDQITALNLVDHVFFTGMVSNVGDYLNLIDVFVQPSIKEGFGISIIESMYKKKPVITTNVGGPLEYIKNNVSGILIPPRNVELLVEAMDALLNNVERRNNIGIRAKEVVENRFLPVQYAARISKIYFSLMEKYSH